MKLLNHTYFHATWWLLPAFIIAGIFTFYTIQYINREETDEFLSYEMQRIKRNHELHSDLPDYLRFDEIIEDSYIPIPVYKDTLILEPGDNEMVPYRECRFSLHHNGKDFEIVLRQIMPGNDDILEGTLMIMFGLILLIIITMFFMLRTMSTRIWKPFQEILRKVKTYQVSETPPLLPDSEIDEFKALKVEMDKFIRKAHGDFKRTREYNENASHELQTQLAIIRASAENLLNEKSHSETTQEQLHTIYQASINLSRIQKSLVLLSKIGNLEYNRPEPLNLKDYLLEAIELYAEASELKQIKLSYQLNDVLLNMDAGLTSILFNNLIKNAVKHNNPKGYIEIYLSTNSLIIRNSGSPSELETNQLMERFVKGKQGNMGIGLAIIKEICELHHFDLSYQIIDKINHQIEIKFNLG